MDLAKWQKLSLAQQLGNIGSEFFRAYHWQEKNDLVNQSKALERALALIDLTLADKRHLRRLKEITRLREVTADLWAQSHVYRVSLLAVQKLLLPYAFIARK